MRVFEISFILPVKILGEHFFGLKIMYLAKHHNFWNFQKVNARLQTCIISIFKSFLELKATVSGGKRIKKTWYPSVTISNLGYFG